MEDKSVNCTSQCGEQNKPAQKGLGYVGNFVRQPKGRRVSVFGEGYVRPNIINMPEDEQ